MIPILEPFKRIWNGWSQPPSLHEDGIETISEYRIRWRSIHIVYFTIFLMILGFSIIITGIWPYLNKLDPNAGKEYMGYVIAATPLGQMLFSPLFGLWGNKIKSVRLPLYVTIGLFCLASAMYSCLGSFPSDSVKYFMLLSRLLVGVGSANLSICRAYIAEATRESERTGAIAMSSMAQAMGFVIGPVLQSCVTPLGEHGFSIIPGFLELNMYTAAGWINVAMAIVNIVLCLPVFFKEKRIAAKEIMAKEGLTSEKETYNSIRIDYFAVWTLLAGVFVISFDHSAIQSVCTSMTMDQFAWSRSEALYYVSMVMSVGAIVSLISFGVVPALCRRYSDRNVLIFVGFVAVVIGRGLNLPFLGGSPPKMAEPLNYSTDATAGIAQNDTSYSSDSIELVGCPISQEWCRTTPALPIFQFCIGYLFTSLGYPITFALLQTMYTKVLGLRPLGAWMGLIAASVCAGRILGPILILNIYAPYGLYWAFGFATMIVLMGMFWTWMIRKRLKSPIRPTRNHETASIDPAVTDARL